MAHIHNKTKTEQERHQQQAQLRPVIDFILKQPVLIQQVIHFLGNSLAFGNKHIPLFDIYGFGTLSSQHFGFLGRLIIPEIIRCYHQTYELLNYLTGDSLTQHTGTNLFRYFSAHRRSLGNLITHEPGYNIFRYRLHFTDILRRETRNLDKCLFRNMIGLFINPFLHLFKQRVRIGCGQLIGQNKTLRIFLNLAWELLPVDRNLVLSRDLIILIQTQNPVKKLGYEHFITKRHDFVNILLFLGCLLLCLECRFVIRNLDRCQNLFITGLPNNDIVAFRQELWSQADIK
ncbi:hypothetical protein D3C85_1168440 [compost metagenome]